MTQDEIIEMVREADLDWHTGWTLGDEEQNRFVAFANLVAAKEREACAKVVEDSPSYDWHKFACEAAYAIRARGQA